MYDVLNDGDAVLRTHACLCADLTLDGSVLRSMISLMLSKLTAKRFTTCSDIAMFGALVDLDTIRCLVASSN